MEIFEATIFDLPQLVELFDLYRQFYKQQPDLTGAQSFLAERIKNRDSVIYSAIDSEGKMTGFVQCYPVFTSVGMRKSWLLNDLFVRKEYRGKGISRLLIDQCKQLAKETNSKGILLETEKANKAGNQLYPSTGFSLADKVNFYYWENK